MKRKCLLLILLFSVLHVTIGYSQSIHRLVKSEEVDSVQWILANQPELINARDAIGRTPLMYCSEVKNEDLLTFFLKIGAKAGIKDNWGNDAINVASFNGYKKGVELLLNRVQTSILKTAGTLPPYIMLSELTMTALSDSFYRKEPIRI